MSGRIERSPCSRWGFRFSVKDSRLEQPSSSADRSHNLACPITNADRMRINHAAVLKSRLTPLSEVWLNVW